MARIAKKVIEKIEEQHLKPAPRWQFKLHEVLLWVFFGLAVFLGSFAIAAILHNLLSNDWGAFAQLGKSPFEYVFLSIPYFWIIVFAGLLALAFLDFKKTEGGYKFRSIWIVLLSLGLSLIFGASLFFFGIGEKTDRVFERAPIFNNFDTRPRLWNNPLENTLMGEITKVSEKQIEIEDPQGNTWKVDLSLINKLPDFEVGERIRIMGEKTSENEFKAKIIWPLNQPMFRGRFQNFEMPTPNKNERNNLETRIN